MTPFLESVAKYIFEHHKNNLHEMALVFPNKRARLFFNNYIGKLTDKPVFAPKYYTITEYMQELSGATMADQLTLLFTLYEVYVEVTDSTESFDQFLFYCEMLLADFDDIDKYLVDANMLYKNLSNLKEIEAYFDYLTDSQIKAIEQFWTTFNDSKDSDEKQKFSSLWNVLFKIYVRFNQKLDELQLSYEGKAYRKAIESIKKGEIDFPHSKVAFVGFNALNKCEETLFDRLHNNKKGLFFWDYDMYYIERAEFHEAAYFLKDLIVRYPKPIGFSFESKLTTEDKNIKVYDIATNTGQAKALSLALNDLPNNWKDNPIKTAIALADEALLIPTLTSMPNDIDQVNISMGYPLRETRIFSLTRSLIDLHKNKRISSKGVESYCHDEVMQLLQFGFDTENEVVKTLSNRILKHNLVYIPASEFNHFNGLYKKVFASGITPSNFVDYLIEAVTIAPKYLGNENKSIHTIEREACFRIISQLTRISDILKTTSVPFNFTSLTRLLSKILEGSTIPFTGEPLLGLQVMGVLETRNIDFDNLIILSMNEGIFPKSGHVPSFVPYSLRKGFGMPTVEHQDAIFAYYFYRLLQRSKNVVLLYSSSVVDSKSGDPSRFIHQLLFEKKFNVEKKTISYNVGAITKRSMNIERNTKTLEILRNKYVGPDSIALSPSAINTWLNCQLRFYYRYIAGIKEPDEISEDIEANTLGSILHKTIEDLYGSYTNQILSKEIIDSILKNKSNIEEKLVEAFWSEFLAPEQEFPGHNKVELQGKNTLIKEVILKYLIAILEYDKKIAPFTLKGLEKKYYKEFTTDSGIRVSIGGIIDRIDEKEGQIRIIDYKTGKLKDAFSSIDELFSGDATKRNDAAFQTLLYSLVLAKETDNLNIQPGLYFVRNIRKDNYSSKLLMGEPFKKKTPINSLQDVLSDFEPLLMHTLNEIFASEGKFEQTEDERYCGYCPYNDICGKN